MSVLLMEAGGPSYASVGGTAHPDWLNGANISRVDCPGLYNSIFDNSQSSTQSLLCNGAINAFGGCCVGGSTAVNAGLYIAPPDSDWDSWGIASWSSSSVNQSAAALEAMCGRGESVTSTDGQLYLQSSYNAMSKWLSAAGYSEVDINGQQNLKSKVTTSFQPPLMFVQLHSVCCLLVLISGRFLDTANLIILEASVEDQLPTIFRVFWPMETAPPWLNTRM